MWKLARSDGKRSKKGFPRREGWLSGGIESREVTLYQESIKRSHVVSKELFGEYEGKGKIRSRKLREGWLSKDLTCCTNEFRV